MITLTQAQSAAMDASAPPRVWLQVNPDGDNSDRSEAIPRENWVDLTWCYESIGGQEVVYIRQDLAHHPLVRNMSAEPVAWRFDYCGELMVWLDKPADNKVFRNVTPLYTHPPIAPVDDHLLNTFDLLRKLAQSNPLYGPSIDDAADKARAALTQKESP